MTAATTAPAPDILHTPSPSLLGRCLVTVTVPFFQQIKKLTLKQVKGLSHTRSSKVSDITPGLGDFKDTVIFHHLRMHTGRYH